jgi:hypothetical protein
MRRSGRHADLHAAAVRNDESSGSCGSVQCLKLGTINAAYSHAVEEH